MTGRPAVRAAVRKFLAAFCVLYAFFIWFKLNSNFYPPKGIQTIQLTLPPLPVRERPYYSLANLHCLTRVIYGEAKGEDDYGKHLVAMVVLNRAERENTTDICRIARKPQQFHGYHTSMNVSALVQFKAFVESYQIAEEAIDRYETAYSEEKSLLWFHADYVRPYWARRFELRYAHGKHLFYRQYS